MTSARIRIAAGAIAPASVRDKDAMVRKNMDMVKVQKKDMSRKKKNAPGSRLRLVMKYSVRLKMIALAILYGMSVSIDAMASADGWYSACLECFSTIGRCA